MGDETRPSRPSRAAQIAVDAIEWQASGDPYPPASIAHLSTSDQAALAREAHRVVEAARELGERAERREATGTTS